jgi:hypothetical protein
MSACKLWRNSGVFGRRSFSRAMTCFTRRAHWHHYLMGPKAKPGAPQPTERTLVLKWIPQLKINVDDEHTVIPTIHEVK